MKVLQVHKFYYDRGGDAIYARALTRGLQERGHEVAFFSMHHPRNDASPWSNYFVSHIDFEKPPRGLGAPFRAARLAMRVLYSREANRNLKRIVQAFRPDVAHLHGIHSHLTVSVIRALSGLGVPVVWTLHDYKVVCPAYTLLSHGLPCTRCAGGAFHNCTRHRCIKGSFLASLGGTLEAYVARALGVYSDVSCFVAPSSFLRTILTTMGLHHRVEVIPYFLDDMPGDQSLGERTDGGALFVGRLSPEKGVHTLIDAAASDPEIRLDIVGDGPQRAALEAQAATRGCHNVSFRGWASREDVRRWILRSNFVVVPSVWYENYPLAAMEAMAAGRPVIGTRMGGLVELIGDNERGVLVEPNNPVALAEAMRTLLDNESLRNALGRQARTFALSTFSKNIHLERIERLYAGFVLPRP